MDKKLVPAGIESVGVRQRVHPVEERPEGIFVTLQLDGEVESDKYAHNLHCAERAGTGGGGARPSPRLPSGLLISSVVGSDGRAHSSGP